MPPRREEGERWAPWSPPQHCSRRSPLVAEPGRQVSPARSPSAPVDGGHPPVDAPAALEHHAPPPPPEHSIPAAPLPPAHPDQAAEAALVFAAGNGPSVTTAVTGDVLLPCQPRASLMVVPWTAAIQTAEEALSRALWWSTWPAPGRRPQPPCCVNIFRITLGSRWTRPTSEGISPRTSWCTSTMAWTGPGARLPARLGPAISLVPLGEDLDEARQLFQFQGAPRPGTHSAARTQCCCGADGARPCLRHDLGI